MRKFSVFFVSLILIACSSTETKQSNKTFAYDIAAHQDISEADRGLWFGYSMGVGMCIQKHSASYEHYPLECEKSARMIMAQMYENETDKSQYTGTYAKALYSVYKAGFVEAYVWVNHHQVGWTEPANVQEFRAWAATNLVDHSPQTKFIGRFM
jgi:hypothetical protein